MDKPNKTNSSIMQALLDLKSSGGDACAIAILTQQLENDNRVLEDAEKLFKKHQHPEHTLKWCKLYGNVEFSRFLSVNALSILVAMCQNMNHWNLLQINYRTIIEITPLNSLKSVKPALQELMEKGCIAVQIEGTTKSPAVYKVNPEIAIVGDPIPHHKDMFWSLVQENSGSDDKESSAPYKRWDALTSKRTYAKGNDYREIGSKKYRFNKINEPRLAKHELKKNGSTPSDNEDEGLPYE